MKPPSNSSSTTTIKQKYLLEPLPLDLVPYNSNSALTPSFAYDARNVVKKAAGEMAKVKESMDAAYTLYEAWEKLYPHDYNKAEAHMGMGDILLAQGKPVEAKAKYQLVVDKRKTYDDGKIAQEKIRKTEAQTKPAGAQ